MREVENYEISLVKEPAPSQEEKAFLSFDMNDLPGIPRGATAACLLVGPDGYGCLRVTFEDSSAIEEVEFPRCPPGLVEVVRPYEWLGVVGLSPDGEQMLIFSSVRLVKE